MPKRQNDPKNLAESNKPFKSKKSTDIDNKTHPYFVGIAASAGGLEAVSLLVQNLPKKANAIYIIAQHMSPTHKSLLTELISRETMLTVQELDRPVKPKLDTIYVTPPNKDVLVENGQLVLKETIGPSFTPKPSADRLFESLAKDQGPKSVAIILSGTGSDGSYGVQSIREAGGITIAQESKSAKYDGMPSAGIETGCIDLTLTPEQIGLHLSKILSTPRDLESLKNLNLIPTRHTDLLKILAAHTGVNFSEYKENTINRRIARRMVALGIEEYQEYVKVCREQVAEVDALFRDLLISVTRFFRDPKHFQQLSDVIKRLIETQSGQPVRAWVAGCATGEEAYSIAILFAEALGGIENLSKHGLQIFASDIDNRALEVARRGVYPIAAVNDIPKAYLEKYFDLQGSSLRVKPALRNVILFSSHDMTVDAPFINVDLISIRNVLIYFNSSLQDRVLNRLHYAMNPNGILSLGNSESVGPFQSAFEIVTGCDKIFTKRIIGSNERVQTLPGRAFKQKNRSARHIAVAHDSNSDLPLFEALAKSVAPDGFIVTKDGQIARVFGDITDIISVSENSVLNLSTRILVEGLRDEATSTIAMVLNNLEARKGRWHEISKGEFNRLRLRAYPIASPTGGEDHVLFALERKTDVQSTPRLQNLTNAERDEYIRRVETDMLETKDALQHTIEELQTSNEELQSVNEELQSANEELEATNEEMETSNEELQSTNEELITVNEEMQVNAAELQKISSELESTLGDASYPVLIVDTALIIRRLSRRAKSFFGIDDLPTAGLHLGQCEFPEYFPPILGLCNDCLRFRKSENISITSTETIMTVKITPYYDGHGQILGLQISVFEADSQSLSLAALNKLTDVMDEMGDISHWRVDVATGQLYWSDEVFRIHGMDPTVDKVPSIEDAINFYKPSDREEVRRKLEEATHKRKPFKFEATIVRQDGKEVAVSASCKVIEDNQGNVAYLVGAFRDQTASVQNQLLVRQLETVQNNLNIGFFSFDIANSTPFWSQKLFEILGYDQDKDVPTVEAGLQIIAPEFRDMVSNKLDKAIKSGNAFEYSARIVRKDGVELPCYCSAQTLKNNLNEITHVFGYFQTFEESGK